MPKHDKPICTLPLISRDPGVTIDVLRAVSYLALAEQAMRVHQAPDEHIGPEWAERGMSLYETIMDTARFNDKRRCGTKLK